MYCNYSKDKFGNELTFICPAWLESKGKYDKLLFVDTLKKCEAAYLNLVNGSTLIEHKSDEDSIFTNESFNSWTPQQARAILPNTLKTEIVVTGYEEDWRHFLDLRFTGTTGAPHPDMLELATLIKAELEKGGFVYEGSGNA